MRPLVITQIPKSLSRAFGESNVAGFYEYEKHTERQSWKWSKHTDKLHSKMQRIDIMSQWYTWKSEKGALHMLRSSRPTFLVPIKYNLKHWLNME